MLLDQPDRSEVMQWDRRGDERRGGRRSTLVQSEQQLETRAADG